MPGRLESDSRQGPRYLATIEVRAEWDEPGGAHVVTEGVTENVGPDGTLLHLPKKLPQVGSRVVLQVESETGEKLQVIGEVLRIERNPSHPQAAVSLLGETDEWRGLIWEPAAPKITVPPPSEETEEDEEVEGEADVKPED